MTLLSWLCIVLATGGKPTTAVGKALNYGGTITYGFYMYHLFAIMLFLHFVQLSPDWNQDPFSVNFVMYTGPFILSLSVSALSYELYESRVQKLKRFFGYEKTPPKSPTEQKFAAVEA